MYKVILLTGVPASGKSTLARALASAVSPVQTVSFGELILRLKTEAGATLDYPALRTKPSTEAPPALVEQARERLLAEVRQLRVQSNVIIDSHAVAKDEYGFRVTPDSSDYLRALQLDAIVILHPKPEDVVARIAEEPAGRREVDVDNVIRHSALQDAVSIAYAVSLGCPVFTLDAHGPLSDLVLRLLAILESIGMKYAKREQN